MPRKSKAPETSLSFMPFEDIQDREADTRTLNERHVKALELSILAIGLIEPLVVDQDGILLAGGHRKAAIASIHEDPKLFETIFPKGVPVQVMPFSAVANPERALQVEIAENEHRRDYTKKEIKGIAQRLKQAGFEELKGRPTKQQKPLMPALSAVVGKSIRQLRRIMNEESRTDDPLSDGQTYLRRALTNLEKWQQLDGEKPEPLSTQIERMLYELRDGIG